MPKYPRERGTTADEFDHGGYRPIKLFPLRLALPHCYHSPAQGAEFSGFSNISFLIGRDFLRPIRPIRRGRSTGPAAMSVPETAMNEDYCSVFRKRQVRTARQRRRVKNVAQSLRMQPFSQSHLRGSVSLTNARHQCATSLLCKGIDHAILYSVGHDTSGRMEESSALHGMHSMRAL